jgi:hypothetical protein
LLLLTLPGGERVVRGMRGSLREGLAIVKANADLDHFLALLILGCMIIAVYLAMEEISHAMGRGGANAPVLQAPEYSVSEGTLLLLLS